MKGDLDKSMRLCFRSGGVLAIAVTLLAGCKTIESSPPITIRMRTDSTEIGVRVSQDEYLAKIDFAMINDTGQPISRGGCTGPAGPSLEKQVGSEWVYAYSGMELMCRRIPDFSIENGASYRGTLYVGAFPKAHNPGPRFEVTPVDGVYRLRWDWAQGLDASDPHARKVEAISNDFHMTLVK